MRALASLVALAPIVSGCGLELTTSDLDASAEAAVVEAGIDTGESDAANDVSHVVDVADAAAETASSGAQPCNDGTGAMDCCPVGAECSTACANPGFHCWTRCTFASPDAGQGVRSQLFCASGTWAAGLGLFPCQRDAGP
jgi:hypothetical protein